MPGFRLFCREWVGVAFRILAQQVQLAASQLRTVEGAWLGYKDVHLERGLQVDQVEGAITADCVAYHLRIGIEGIAQCPDQRFGMFRAQVGYQVSVHRGAHHAVHRAGR